MYLLYLITSPPANVSLSPNKLGAVPLEFRLTFDGSRLTTYSSPESKGVWREVSSAMVKQLLGVTGK